jgi:hypothetical protein
MNLKNMNLKSSMLLSSAIAAGVFVSPLPTYAWNIVCGVSILSFGAATMSTKWEADSAALRGIGAFYAAIADLQNVNVEIATQSATSSNKSGEVSKLESASAQFKQSRSLFQEAIAKANQLATPSNPLDNIGTQSIALWQKMADANAKFIAALDGGTLPDLYGLHEAIDTIHQIGSIGMRASLMHLNQHKEAHTTGGPSVKFK